MHTQDDVERARIERIRIEHARHRAQIRAKGDERSTQELELAREKAMEIGYEFGRILACQELLNQAQTPRQELAALSIDELRTRADELEKEAMAKRRGS